jgi:hypothetical protein
MILQGLRDAGLNANEIQDIVDDAEIGKTLMGLAVIDSLPPSDIPALVSQQTDSSRALSQFYTQASRLGMTVLDWAKRDGPEFVGRLCDLANALSASGVRHPVVAIPSAVCTTGRFAKTTYSTFRRADAVFNRRYDEGKRAGGVGSSSSSSSSQQQGSQRAFPGSHQPIQPPNTLPAFPKAIRVDPKTFVQGGGGMRKRWEDKRHVYEWDSKSGKVEKYSKATKEHLGEFNHITGEQTKRANPAWKLRD